MPSKVYLPQIHSSGIAPQSEQGALTPEAAAFATYWLSKLEPSRAQRMVCDRRLVVAAQRHAEFLNARTPEWIAEMAVKYPHNLMHIGQNFTYANERALAQNYSLPSFWERRANYIESCARVYATPDKPAYMVAVDALIASPSHRPMMLLEQFWAVNFAYGVGHAGADFVFVCAPPEA